MTQRANHAGPPLLHKNPMSDPRQLAGDLITAAPESWGVTSDPPSLNCKPDKNGIIHHSLHSSGAHHYKIRIKIWNLQENRHSQGIHTSASRGPAHGATLIINDLPAKRKPPIIKRKYIVSTTSIPK